MTQVMMQAVQSGGVSDQSHEPSHNGSIVNSASWTQAQCDLWEQLKQFTIGDESWSLSFAVRLAREQGWTKQFAAKAIEEYKKFLFLGMHAGHSVTPSEEVDAVWHLHMIYTRSYWDELCKEVLQQPFHHGPTKGGSTESAKFHDWYERTLDSYRRFFGEPPADIWPAADQRFATAPRWVDLNTMYVVSRAKVNRALRFTLAALGIGAAVAFLFFLTGAYANHVPALSTSHVFAPTLAASSRESIVIAVAIFALVVLILLVAKYGQSSRSDGSGCSSGTGCGVGGCSSDGGSGCSGGSGCGGSGCGGGGCGGGGCGGGCGG